MKKSLQNYFVTGLLVSLPIVITVALTQSIIVWVDQIVPINQLIGVYVPGLGLVVALLIIFLAGVIGRNFLGEWIMDQLSRIINRIPFIGSVYGSLRQVMTTLISTQGDKFGRAVLVEYPRPNCWSIGFVTASEPIPEVKSKFNQKMTCVFVPTTPNPTSGFFIFVPAELIKPLDLSVEEAFKVVVSLGLVGPGGEVRRVST